MKNLKMLASSLGWLLFCMSCDSSGRTEYREWHHITRVIPQSGSRALTDLVICQPTATMGLMTTAAVSFGEPGSGGGLLNDLVDAHGCVTYRITREVLQLFLSGFPGPATIRIGGVTQSALFDSSSRLSLELLPRSLLNTVSRTPPHGMDMRMMY